MLQSPVRLGSLRLPHRIMMGSMHLNRELADPRALAAFYVERVRGGAGLIITGAAAVNQEGAGGAGYTLIRETAHQDRWRKVVTAVHDAGGLIGLQLFHAGRYASRSAFGLSPVAPSAVYSGYSRDTPDAMTDAQIAATIADFQAAAEVAVALGFDAVEVMGSEGYLLNQFASPVTNLRDDAWGGDPARRREFPVAVARAVRHALGSTPMLMRLSGADLVPGSSTPEEADALAIACVRAGADAIDVGIGWHESRVPTVQSLVPHGAWVPVAARVKTALVEAAAAVPVIAANRIVSLDQAERILGSGVVDLVSLARPFLADPRILSKSFAGHPTLVNTCIGCNEACIDRSLGREPVSCLVNPTAGRELEFSVLPRTSARVAVVGAGPAGMEAARALADAGALVSLFEAGQRIGGQFLMAGMVPGKSDFLETVRYFEHELARLGVRVKLGVSIANAAKLAGFDHVVVSTGVHPRGIAVPGAGLPLVLDYAHAFRNPDAVGDAVAIIGAGGIGVDLAHLLCAVRAGSVFGCPAPITNGRESFLIANGLADGTLGPSARRVTLMRRAGAIGAGMGATTRWAVVSAIRRAGVRTVTDVTYQAIDSGGVWVERDGIREHIEADTVVVAAGQESNDALAGGLAAAGIAHTVIGGALAASGTNAVVAFDQGLRAAAAIAAALPAAG
ncbi:MAG: FAD-dependent oxidoreductase [Microbacteriaceae bacterium]